MTIAERISELKTSTELAAHYPRSRNGKRPSRSTIKRLWDSGILAYVKVGGRRMSTLDDLMKAFEHAGEQDRQRRGITPRPPRQSTATSRERTEAVGVKRGWVIQDS